MCSGLLYIPKSVPIHRCYRILQIISLPLKKDKKGEG
jgi:hypothetical protein